MTFLSKKLSLLLVSLSIFTCSSDVVLATSYSADAKKSGFYDTEDSDLYKYVSYNVDKNIKIAADTYGENYWALKAIRDKNAPFHSSIKVLKKIIYCFEKNKNCYTHFYLMLYKLIEQYLNKGDHSNNSLDSIYMKKAFGVINFLNVAYGIHLYISSTEEQSLNEVWDRVCQNMRKSMRDDTLNSGENVYSYILSKFNNNKEEFESCIKHDWLCYLNQFNVASYDYRQFRGTGSFSGGINTAHNDYGNKVSVLGALRLTKTFNIIYQIPQGITKNKKVVNFDSGNIIDLTVYDRCFQDTKTLCSTYNTELEQHGLLRDIYKIDINQLDLHFMSIFDILYSCNKNHNSEINPSDAYEHCDVLLKRSIQFTKKLIDKNVRLSGEYNQYINPKVIFRLMYSLFFQDMQKITLDDKHDVCFNVFKMFADLQLTDFSLSDITLIADHVLKRKSTVVNLTKIILQIINSIKTKDFHEEILQELNLS